jgi:hypothetical protein
MPVINELVVKSKYSSNQVILSKSIELGNHDNIKIIDVISHTEKLLSMKFIFKSNFIDVNLLLGIYFIYYREKDGIKEPCSYFTEELVCIRAKKEDFLPVPHDMDFISGEFTGYAKNIKANYDIDMHRKSVIIEVSASVVVNLVEENSITIDESMAHSDGNEMEEFDEIPLSSVAISRDYFGGDIKSYLYTLGEISRAINKKITEYEEENRRLKEQIEKIEVGFREKSHHNMELIDKMNSISGDYTKLTEKMKDLKEKYDKVQIKANLLETENMKYIEEIEQLRRERNELAVVNDKGKTKFRDKIKEFIARL